MNAIDSGDGREILDFTLYKIGTVISKNKIEILPQYTPALTDIETFSHIYVLFILDKVAEGLRHVLSVKPRMHTRHVGVFACRSPIRPNPVGLTLVKLLKRKKNILYVKGLDADIHSPVIDLKPYIHFKFNPILPEWAKRPDRTRRIE